MSHGFSSIVNTKPSVIKYLSVCVVVLLVKCSSALCSLVHTYRILCCIAIIAVCWGGMMVLQKMLLFALLVLIAVQDIKPQPVSCAEDLQCMAGFFCVERTRRCRECLSCENLGRSPPSIQNACIKSGDECGLCLQGLMNDDANWDGMCIIPNTRSWKLMSSYYWILVICVATGALLSLFIVHGIIYTLIIKVDIAMSPFPKVKNQIELIA